MISHKMKIGEDEIVIETAENLKEIQTLKMPTGSRHLVNGKEVCYGTMVQFIVKKSAENSKSFMPEKKDIERIRLEMIESQKAEIRNQLEILKEHYKDAPEDVLRIFDEQFEKINEYGVRVHE